MATKRDYYEVLGVSQTATRKEIEDVYRDLAMKYHPDRNAGDEEAAAKFKEAAEAFDILSHPEQRARYDRYGHAGVNGEGGAGRFHDASDIFAAFGDIFGDIFGQGTSGRRVRQGANIRCEVKISLQQAARGTKKTIRFRQHRACEACGGSGARPGTRPEQCNYCGGAGRVVQSTGFFSMQTTCPGCKGTGTIIKDPCPQCRGSGFVQAMVQREVAIPAGVDEHTRLRLAGDGEPSPEGGPPGDCYVFISIAEHPLFKREGQHLLCQVPIAYSQAALGAVIEVPTLDGPHELTIPPGTQVGDVFRMVGLGMPRPRHRGRGDLLVQLAIEVPTKVVGEHEEVLRRLAELEHIHVSPKRKSFFEKLKKCFVPTDESEKTEE
ncbi:MAG: molecular chaperone DnaJ [Pirellulales bacterium]|nr:molecular chaperone DnaJ [Pirellulales bacterium]